MIALCSISPMGRCSVGLSKWPFKTSEFQTRTTTASLISGIG